jgi:hypothetical protein
MRQWEQHFAMGHGETEAFLKDLESFESINRLLDVAEGRRTAALNEIASYRKTFSPCLRKALDDIIEGEFIEHDAGLGAAGGALASKAANGPDPGGVPVAKAADGRRAGDGLVAEGPGDAGSKVAGSEDAILAENHTHPAAPAGGALVTGGTGSGAGRDRVRETANDPTRREVA